MVKKMLRICVMFTWICLHTIPACDGQTDRPSDRQTDRQTSCHGIVRAMHTRRVVKKTAFEVLYC